MRSRASSRLPRNQPSSGSLFESPALRLVDGLMNPTGAGGQSAVSNECIDAPIQASGQSAEYELFDQVWLSPALAGKQAGAFIDRRTRKTGDGSDHDPAWVVLTL